MAEDDKAENTGNERKSEKKSSDPKALPTRRGEDRPLTTQKKRKGGKGSKRVSPLEKKGSTEFSWIRAEKTKLRRTIYMHLHVEGPKFIGGSKK